MTQTQTEPKVWDVAVVGAGMAGMATALFAAEQGLSVLQIGNGGGLLFASGLLDLLAVHPIASRRLWGSPFDALAAIRRDQPDHPLARVDDATMRAAYESFTSALGAAGLTYAPLDDRNHLVLTSLGTAKPTYGVPRTMAAGVAAMAERVPCLLLDFRGLREFSARQIVATVGDTWPGLRSARIEFPGAEASSELYAAHLARALESHETRDKTIALVKPLLGDARAVGFPAVLGLGCSGVVHAAFQAALGVPVFEIPTMPTSVPGLRLMDALEHAVVARGVHRLLRGNVTSAAFDDTAVLSLGGVPGGETVSARAVVLATGRFTGRGLVAGQQRITEPVLGLPVQQPASRETWHSRDFLDPAGHEVNRAGLRTDSVFRPFDATGRPAWPGLFAVGSILAGQDWMREKCGAGIALGTARVAVDQIVRQLGAR
jgi:glycerol-3-phosphate dehydrogenase subunit B